MKLSNSSSLITNNFYFSVFYKTLRLSKAVIIIEDFRVTPRISTLGVGIETAKGFTPSFGLRAGFNYFSYGYEATESDVSYDLDLELKSFRLMADGLLKVLSD